MNDKPQKARFSSSDKSWRVRSDIVEIINGKEEKACLTANMARRYAYLYLFYYYFKKRRRKAWVNDVLTLIGWDPSQESIPYRMSLYFQIRMLRLDFNVEIEIVKAPKEERCNRGISYYEVKSLGIFKPQVVNSLFKSNAQMFENIIENDLKNAVSSYAREEDKEE